MTTAANASHEALARTIAVINGKGGVGKTSITANVGGVLAQAGYRVLLVDADISGNLGVDLGYRGDEEDDRGKRLVDAIWHDTRIEVLSEVRPNLDVITGGRATEMLAAIENTGVDLSGGTLAATFAQKLAEIAEDYDVVLIDCAPGNPALQMMALAAARYVLIPTKTDAGGWDGLLMVGPRVKKARVENPALSYLGVVLFGHSPNASRVGRATRAKLDEVAETVPIFDAFIRHSQGAAYDCRARGQLVHELAVDANRLREDRLKALRSRKPGSDNVIEMPTQLSTVADSLAGDYQALAREVLLRISQHEAADTTDAPAADARGQR